MKCSYKELFDLVAHIFEKYGCSQLQAVVIAQSLLYSECSGDSAHGLKIIKQHIDRIQDNGYNLNSEIHILIDNPNFAKVDCNNMIGMYSAKMCMNLAIEKAKELGIYTVFANNCNTCSAAFVYTLQAAKEGLIGILMSNTPATMAPFGGCTRLFGTNPLSYAIPAKNEKPIVFDMATSVVAKSTIVSYRDRGEIIPEGWAYDKKGKTTTDPQTALEGLMAPLGGAKGYGLSMMIDIFAGFLSGAGFLNNVNNFFNNDNTAMNVGQMFVAINPVLIYGSDFYDNMDNYIRIIKSSKTNDRSNVRIPGERKISNIEKGIRSGIDIEDSLYFELCHLLK